MTGIYKITNLVNSRVYIGASKNVEKRWSEHRNGRTAIAGDLQIFGLDNFKFEVLLECPEDMLCQWERDMICLYDSDDPEKGYNCKNDRPYSLERGESLKGKPSGMKGHVAWNRGLKTSDETKRKMSEANRGHTVSEETKRKLSEFHRGQTAWNRGLKTSDETKRKISEAKRGRSRSDETRRKISEAHKGLSASEETRRKISEARKEYWRKKKELNGLKIHSNNELKIHSNNEKQNK